ncbi:CPBP family intramembrane glutamic endopeptidase [Microbacterium album]|uniref:CAAX prenyl protease 2/Lysostaphin resistance protein A-like domain-containing protein n=1 Tax=Microbacterium album TaxID=2053191 RepID=A0A917MN38_9MICO|nr:CPBP family intramembrane glutamic endopeptidase [Microbacterium album]GGH38687.1 hypothetical protein GCM10010921_09430 [Microbacterium album]
MKPSPRSVALALGLAAGIGIARFGVIVGALELAPVLGIAGWYAGLFANALCVLFAAGVVTMLGVWRDQGVLRLWRSPLAALWLLPFVAEGVLRFALPGSIVVPPPGLALWILTLVLASLNEELINRVAVLSVLRRATGAVASAILSGALFGLAHLSLLVTTPSRSADDILLNVLASATYGFALAAFQLRFRWLLPLVLVHAFANASVIFVPLEVPLVLDVIIHAGFVVVGAALLVSRRRGFRPGRTR